MKHLLWPLHSIVLIGVEELKGSMQSTLVTCPSQCALYKNENRRGKKVKATDGFLTVYMCTVINNCMYILEILFSYSSNNLELNVEVSYSDCKYLVSECRY
jgi:hypothetical protein